LRAEIILTDALISFAKMDCCVGFAVTFASELAISLALVIISVSFNSFTIEVRFLAYN